MILPRDFKRIHKELQRVLKEITENELYSNFIVYINKPDIIGQYWEYEVSIITNEEIALERPCRYFISNDI